MSQSITITRTTTSSANTSYIVLNTGYLKTFPGILKLLELVLGVICVAILGISSYYGTSFFFNMAICFMIGTFILLLSCLVSLSTGGIISKTIYEVLYHTIAGVLLLIASAIFISNLNHHYSSNSLWIAGIFGLINSGLYFISAFLANKSYRGI
ncbi:hypothetical protein ACFFRR_003048 [Megaselia abdita]